MCPYPIIPVTLPCNVSGGNVVLSLRINLSFLGISLMSDNKSAHACSATVDAFECELQTVMLLSNNERSSFDTPAAGTWNSLSFAATSKSFFDIVNPTITSALGTYFRRSSSS